MKRDLSLFIEDILEKIDLIEDSTEEVSRDKFELDELLIDATVRRLEIIGEAVKNLPYSFREKHPEVPWKGIVGFRDVVTHTYFKVDYDAVWNIIKKDLPDLKKKMLKIKEELKKD